MKKWPSAQPEQPSTITQLRVDKAGSVTLRNDSRLHHIGVGRTHARTHVKIPVHDHDATVVDTATGVILKELTIDPTRDHQPTGRPPGPTPTTK